LDFNSFINQKRKFKFLIIRDGLIGDITFLTPIINRLKNKFSDSVIDIVISSNSEDVLKNYPGVRRIFLLKSKAGLLYHIKFFFSLRKEKYDVCLIQEVNSHYTLMSLLISAKYRVGFKNKADKYLDIINDRKGHAVLAELGSVSNWTEVVNEDRTTLFTTEDEDVISLKLLSDSGISEKDFRIVLQVGCSEENSPREWLLNYYAELADRLAKKFGAKIIFTGVKSEMEKISKVQSMMKTSSTSLAGRTDLRTLFSIIKHTHLVIGPDTGTLHVANAFGVPTLMLIGYADPLDTGVYDTDGYSKNVHVELDCLPCKFKNPKPQQWEICKVKKPTLCMEMLSVDIVEKEVIEILNKKYNFSDAN